MLGAAGSAGGAAVQLGRALGAQVIAVAGGEPKLEFCRQHGAHETIDYRSEDVAEKILELTDGRGADLIYDTVGGATATVAVNGLARGGRIALIGLASGAPVALNAMDMLLRNYSAVGVLATPLSPEDEAAAWQRLSELAADGRITTPVGRVYAFADVPAMVAGQSAPAPGKSVVRVVAQS